MAWKGESGSGMPRRELLEDGVPIMSVRAT